MIIVSLLFAKAERSGKKLRLDGKAPTACPSSIRRPMLGIDDHQRLLLVEEEDERISGDDDTARRKLSHSLTLNAAYTLAASSTTSSSSSENADEARTPECRVVLLVGSNRTMMKKTKKETKKRRRCCNDILDDVLLGDIDNRKWDPTILSRIQIKYVSSLSDVVGYLAYVTSLPKHNRPTHGLFILGVDRLLSRQNNAGMELVHLLALLSDTAHALDDKNNREWQQMKSTANNNNAPPRIDDNYGEEESSYRNISIMATIDKCTYSSLSAKVVGYIHHWVDVVGMIEPPVVEDSGGHGMDQHHGEEGYERVKNG